MSEQEIIYKTSQTKHWKTLFSHYDSILGAHNMNPGEELVAEIMDVQKVTVKWGEGKEEKKVPCLFFHHDTGVPPLTLNVTNGQTIETLYGDQYPDWVGKKIQIFSCEVEDHQGRKTTGLRIRGTIPSSGVDVEAYNKGLRACKTIRELQTCFTNIPLHLKGLCVLVKDEMKGKL